MTTLLKNVVQFAGLVVGVPVALPHGLNVNDVPVAPQLGGASASGFTITANTTNVIVTRTVDAASGSVNVYVERWHTIESALPLPGQLAGLVPFFFAAGGGGGGGTFEFLPTVQLVTSDLPAGITNDWVPVGVGPVWPNPVRIYCGGDAGAGSKVTGIDSTGIPVGKVFVFETGDSGHGPITLLDWQDPAAATSLAQNRIVCPGPLAAGVEIPEGGVFAIIKIEDGSGQHGWRVLWLATNTSLALQSQHEQLVHPLAITLPAGNSPALATAGILTATRLQITTNVLGSKLSGITHAALGVNSYGEGALKIIENMGPGPLTMGHLSGSAFDLSFYTPNAIDQVLGVGSVATLLYDAAIGCWAWVSSSQTRNVGLGPELVPTVLPAGDTDDWNPSGLHETSRVLVTCNAAGSTLTGINAGQDGEVKYISVAYGGPGPLTLAEYRTSSGVNRFILPNLVDLIIPPGGGVAIVYKGGGFQAWFVLAGG